MVDGVTSPWILTSVTYPFSSDQILTQLSLNTKPVLLDEAAHVPHSSRSVKQAKFAITTLVLRERKGIVHTSATPPAHVLGRAFWQAGSSLILMTLSSGSLHSPSLHLVWTLSYIYTLLSFDVWPLHVLEPVTIRCLTQRILCWRVSGVCHDVGIRWLNALTVD